MMAEMQPQQPQQQPQQSQQPPQSGNEKQPAQLKVVHSLG
jgi:hypothetical protein